MRQESKRDIRNILAVIIVLASVVLTYIFMVMEIPVQNRDIIMVITGAIYGGSLQTITAYYFGSTKSEVDRRKSKSNSETNES